MRAERPENRRQGKRRGGGRTAPVLGAAVVAGTATLLTAAPARAHGNVNDPVARNYRCLKVWGNRHLDPAMKTEDPMCDQAFRTDPNAMWNWNGLLRDGLKGQYRTGVPDGTLCSAGHAEGGRYDPLDVPGPWIATDKPPRFRLNLVDQASHGADFLEVYVSRDSHDPLTERLGWDDLALVGRTGKVTGGGTVDPAVGGSAYAVDVDATGYPGRRVLFTVWKASHSDQTYFLCSDTVVTG